MISGIRMSPPEWAAVISMLFFISLPIPIPMSIAEIVATIPGVFIVFAINVALLLYTTPYIGVVAILAATELIRRSYREVSNNIRVPYTGTPTIPSSTNVSRPAAPMIQQETSLEEIIVNQMAPVGQTPTASFVDTSFAPTYTNVHNAMPM